MKFEQEVWVANWFLFPLTQSQYPLLLISCLGNLSHHFICPNTVNGLQICDIFSNKILKGFILSLSTIPLSNLLSYFLAEFNGPLTFQLGLGLCIEICWSAMNGKDRTQNLDITTPTFHMSLSSLHCHLNLATSCVAKVTGSSPLVTLNCTLSSFNTVMLSLGHS